MISEQKKRYYENMSSEDILKTAYGTDYGDGLEEAYEERYGHSYRTRSRVIFAIYNQGARYLVKPVMMGMSSGTIRQLYTLTISANTFDEAKKYVFSIGKKLHSIVRKLGNRVAGNPRIPDYIDIEEVL